MTSLMTEFMCIIVYGYMLHVHSPWNILLYNVRVILSALWGSFFSEFHPRRIVRNEPNLDCFQHEYTQIDAENFGSVCFMVREKIDSRTDRQE